jgi:hypothetical protein
LTHVTGPVRLIRQKIESANHPVPHLTEQLCSGAIPRHLDLPDRIAKRRVRVRLWKKLIFEVDGSEGRPDQVSFAKVVPLKFVGGSSNPLGGINTDDPSVKHTINHLADKATVDKLGVEEEQLS